MAKFSHNLYLCFLTEFTSPHGYDSFNPQAGGQRLVTVRDFLFNIFAGTLHIGGRFSIRNRRTRRAVVIGYHLTKLDILLLWTELKLHTLCDWQIYRVRPRIFTSSPHVITNILITRHTQYVPMLTAALLTKFNRPISYSSLATSNKSITKDSFHKEIFFYNKFYFKQILP